MTDQIEALEAVEPEVLTETPEEDINPQPETGEEGDPPEGEPEAKPKKTAQDRINELTRKAREAEREREYWREAALSGRVSALESRQAQVHPRDTAPNPDDFAGGDIDPRFMIAQAKFEAKQEIRAEQQAEQQARTTQERVQSFIARESSFFPEGESDGLSAYKSMPHINPVVQDVVLTSDKGPLLAEYFGDNPAALHRLSALPAHMMGFELAKIEAGLGTTPAPAPSPNRLTQAPSPAPKPRGVSGQFSVAPDTNDFGAFEKYADRVRST